jgi:feruloyl esterase
MEGYQAVYSDFLSMLWSKMKPYNLTHLLSGVPFAASFSCTPDAFQRILPSNASVAFAYPVALNATFEVPSGDIAYPVSPTKLPQLCAVHIQVQSSLSSHFGFGIFLPEKWNERFLAVGNVSYPLSEAVNV